MEISSSLQEGGGPYLESDRIKGTPSEGSKITDIFYRSRFSFSVLLKCNFGGGGEGFLRP